MFRMRNSSGSTPAAYAITSICCSAAKRLVLAAGARHGPTAKGCMLEGPVLVSFHSPYTRTRRFGTS